MWPHLATPFGGHKTPSFFPIDARPRGCTVRSRACIASHVPLSTHSGKTLREEWRGWHSASSIPLWWSLSNLAPWHWPGCGDSALPPQGHSILSKVTTHWLWRMQAQGGTQPAARGLLHRKHLVLSGARRRRTPTWSTVPSGFTSVISSLAGSGQPDALQMGLNLPLFTSIWSGKSSIFGIILGVPARGKQHCEI